MPHPDAVIVNGIVRQAIQSFYTRAAKGMLGRIGKASFLYCRFDVGAAKV